MKRHYLYLLAWMHGSDSACGDETEVHKQEDLMPQWEDHNPNVFVIVVMNCPTEDLAGVIGDSEAFDNNYTAHDSLSTVEEIDEDHEAFDCCKVVDASEYLRGD